MMLVNPAAPRPISAGIQPELESMLFHRIHVEVGESGAAHLRIADVGAVHGEGASTPRCPLMANCAVKLVAPLASVMVPAASNSRVLKSRLFSGSSLTAWLESSSPPVAAAPFPEGGDGEFSAARKVNDHRGSGGRPDR